MTVATATHAVLVTSKGGRRLPLVRSPAVPRQASVTARVEDAVECRVFLGCEVQQPNKLTISTMSGWNETHVHHGNQKPSRADSESGGESGEDVLLYSDDCKDDSYGDHDR